MRELILENQISIHIKQILREKTFTFKGVQLHDVNVERFKEPMIVVTTVLSPEQPITPKQVALVQALLVRELGIPLEFKLQIIPATQITATGASDDQSEPAKSTQSSPKEVESVQTEPTITPDEAGNSQTDDSAGSQ